MANVKPGNLARGSKGKAVEALQKALNEWGYSLKVDGIFGGNTDAAVRHFQKWAGLKSDGIVGPATRAALAGKAGKGKAGKAAKAQKPSKAGAGTPSETWVLEEWYVEVPDEEYVEYEYEYEYEGDDEEDDDEEDDDEGDDEEDDE
ncbi:MAG: peptidoglycan-binding domain-containing protein, partial [Polyangiaceae bacterium]